jgi:hypothetical protein
LVHAGQQHAGDLLPRGAVHEAQLVDVDRPTAHHLPDPETVERTESVGRQLDAGTELGECVLTFQHDDPVAMLRDAQCLC